MQLLALLNYHKIEAIFNGHIWCQLVAKMTFIQLLIISRAFSFSFFLMVDYISLAAGSFNTS